MNYKSIIILILALFVLISIAGVSASDANDTAISSEDTQYNLQINDNNQVIEQTDNDENLSVENDLNVLSTDYSTYSELSREIGSEGNITLQHDYYTYDEGNTIEINVDDIVIDGNGAVIDMAGSNIQVFTVMAHGVTIKNLTLKNAHLGDDMSAIHFELDGIVTNCNFIDNKATIDYCRGGAIYFGSDGIVTNCIFMGNTAEQGGAIDFESGGIVTNCNFTNNTAKYGGAIIFANSRFTGTVTNCNFVNNTASEWGGAIWIYSGTVTNCNFTDNQASDDGGAVYFLDDGKVENCNFTNNTASSGSGGVVYFLDDGKVENCNFTNNTAESGGAVYFNSNGNVTNCNFTNNKATDDMYGYGGAVYFNRNGNVTNCNFTGNNATTGSAICFYSYSATETVSNSCFLNNRANAEALEVSKNENNITITFTGNDNLLNAIYSIDDAEVTFTNVTYWSANGINNTGSSAIKPSRSNKEAGQNITVFVVVNDTIVLNEVKVTDENGKIVVDIAVDGNYIIVARHDTDSYYTQAQTIMTNTQYYVNITSQTTPKTANITAKSNICNEFMPGKLVFILPDNTEINANYAGNGIWWALHTFDDFGEYNVTASYTGLDGVIINNATLIVKLIDSYVSADDVNLDVNGHATISPSTSPENLEVEYASADSSIATVDAFGIVTGHNAGNTTVTITIKADGIHAVNSTTINVCVNRINSSIILDNVVFDYGGSDNVTVETEGTTGISAKIDDKDVNVEGYTIPIFGLNVGSYNLTVTTIPDTNHLAVNKTVTITVRKINSTVKIDDVTLNYGESTIIAIITEGAIGITAKIDDNDVSVINNVILIPSGLEVGNHTLTITTNPDANHNPVTENAQITVNKVDSTIDVNDFEFNYNSTGYTSVLFNGANGVIAEVINQPNAIVNVTGNIITVSGLEVGSYSLSVTTIPDNNHNAVTETVAVTVNKADSSVDVSNIVLDYGNSVGLDVSFDGAVGITAELDGEVILFEGSCIPVSGLDAGVYNLTVTTIPDDNHNAVSKTVTVTVNKVDSEISIADSEIKLHVNDSKSAGASLVPADGELTYVSSNETVATVIDGVIIAHGEGTAVITVSYAGDKNYNAAENKNITVTIAEMFIVGYDVNMTYEDGSAYMVQLVDGNGDPVAKAKEAINITINGRTYNRLTDENGIAKITIHLNASTYPATAQYGKITINNMVTVNKLPIKACDVNMIYKDGSAYMVQLVDKNGNPFAKANQAINITIAGKSYIRYTNAEGIAKITINLAAGTYPVTAQYGNTIINNVVTVNKLLIVASDVNMAYKDGSAYMVQLVDGNGDNVAKANVAVNITIDGRTYTRVTDANGIAKITINLRAGEYPVTAQYGNVIIENMVTVNNKYSISASDLNMSYRDGSAFEVQLVDENGNNYALANEPVKITVAGKTYTRSTDENGIAKITINLAAGTYPVIAEYNNKTISNTITVTKT